MERREAAEYLGVSLSTLDRFASQGRLKRGRARRKTRPVTVFDQGELDRLKEELQAGKGSTAAKIPSAQKLHDAIGFRLDPHYVAILKERGEALGQSPGEYARSLVIQAIENEREERFSEELALLRRGLAKTFYTVLVSGMNVPEDQAKRHVRDALGRG